MLVNIGLLRMTENSSCQRGVPGWCIAYQILKQLLKGSEGAGDILRSRMDGKKILLVPSSSERVTGYIIMLFENTWNCAYRSISKLDMCQFSNMRTDKYERENTLSHNYEVNLSPGNYFLIYV